MKYNYFIDYENQMIKYNLNDTRTVEVQDSLDNNTINLALYNSFDREVEFSYEVKQKGFYYFFVSHCQNDKSSFKVKYVVLNPGNEHLSFDLIPNKVTYLVFFLTWIGVLIVSGFLTGVRALKRRSLSYLSVLILFSYSVITLYLILRYVYWKVFSNNGTVSPYLSVTVNLIEVTSLGIYLVILSMVANGYKIVNNKFSCASFAKYIVIIFFILITSLFLNYVDFFLLFFITSEIIIFVLFLKVDTSICIKRLKEINEMLNPIFVEERSYLESNNMKIKFYNVFTYYLLIYWTLEIILLSLRPFLALYHEWIFTLVQQILTLISMSFLFITLTYSIEFKKFQEIHDGALIAPNPYIGRRGLKI